MAKHFLSIMSAGKFNRVKLRYQAWFSFQVQLQVYFLNFTQVHFIAEWRRRQNFRSIEELPKAPKQNLIFFLFSSKVPKKGKNKRTKNIILKVLAPNLKIKFRPWLPEFCRRLLIVSLTLIKRLDLTLTMKSLLRRHLALQWRRLKT